ncbi:MAG: glycosyltransferase family 2 protein [Winogradskyella sp.]
MKTLAVILPTYNAAHFLEDAIASLLNQTYNSFDIYIIDDCSTDHTKEVVNSFEDSRVNYVKNKKNLGLASTLNLGLELLVKQYKYIARMDADDWAYPDRFQKQIAYLEKNQNIAVCGTQGNWVKSFEEESSTLWKYPFNHEELKYHLLFTACFGHSSVVFRSSFLIENNIKYNEYIKTCEDWDLWTRIIRLGNMANLPDYLMKYRIVQTSNHRSEENQRMHLKERSEVISNHWKSFGIECEREFIYDAYFDVTNQSKEEVKIRLLKLIDMSNRLCKRATNDLNLVQKKRLTYRLLRIIKRTWQQAEVPLLAIDIWFFILRDIKFTSMFNTLKTILK